MEGVELLARRYEEANKRAEDLQALVEEQ